MPVVISGGGAVATVADTPQIDLGLTNAQLTADVVAGSIGSTQLSSAVNSALTLAGTAVQPAALTSYLPLSGGALTTAPSVRTDGSALATGDLWYNPSNGTQWFWNGTYWLSQDLSSVVLTPGAAANIVPLSPLRLHNPGGTTNLHGFVFIEKFSILPVPGGRIPWGDGSNYQTLSLRFFNSNALNQVILSVDSTALPAAYYEVSINTAYYLLGLSIFVVNVGSPENYAATVRGTVFYRNIAP